MADKIKVFVSRKIPQEGLDLLKKECDIEVSPHDRVLSKQELLAGIRGKDALLCLLTDPIDAEILDASPRLRVVSNYAVGFNNVDVKACTARNIPITNTPGVLTETVADHAIALMLAVARRIPEGDRFAKAGLYTGWAPEMMLGNDLYDQTLGILGLGRIGKSVAKRAHGGFGMKIVYYDVVRDKSFEKEFGAKFGTVEDVLKLSDFVSVHVPLLPTTQHLIGEKQLKMMKKTAYIINTSRGPVVDEVALVKALKEKVIAGAGLDVLEFEPKLTPGMENLDNLVVTPHLASATKATRGAMSTLAAQNLLAVINGQDPPTQVNKEVIIGPGFKYPFYMHWGKAVKSAKELGNVLGAGTDNDWGKHVTSERNDFATWVHDVLKNAKLAKKLKECNTRADAITLLKKVK